MRKFSVALALSFIALTSPAWAEGAREEEIIVTAPKRGEARARDLPLAMNALGEAQLRSLNVEDLQSLSYAMPNVQLEDIGTGRGVANFVIRGVGVNSSIASVDPAVGLFVDGMYVGLNAGAITDMFDLEAIEVLRGPQGTLYGRNVTGGAVLVRTRAPSDVFEARARVAVETGPNVITDASITGPLAPGLLAGRFAVLHSKDEGWFHNDRDGASFGANETNIYRAGLRLTPAAGFDATLRLEQGGVDGDGPAAQNHALFSRGGFDFAIDNRGYAATDWEQAILEANWRVPFGDGVITSISAWRDVEMGWAADIDSTPAFVFHTRILNLQDQRSEELRYAGGFGAYDVTAGLYFLDQHLRYFDERNFPTSARRTGGGFGDFRTWAAFANTDWRASAALTFSAGLRYTHEEKRSHISRVRPNNAALAGALGEIGGDLDARTLNFADPAIAQHWDDVSPRLGVQWRPASGANLYAAWSRGFRSGGANFRTTTLGTPPRLYDAEQESTVELGWKQEARDGRWRVNLALFQNQIENMQRETNLPDPVSGVQQIVLNAGDATIHGGEIEARLELTERFSIEAQAGYTHGRYDRVIEDLNGDLAVTAADRALKIPRLAPWSYGVNLRYEAPILGGALSARLGYHHRDAAFYNDTNLGRLAEADIVDAHVGFSPEGAPWSVSFYGENLLNDPTWGGDTILPSAASFGFSGGARPTFSPLNKGRVLGAELRLRY